MDPETIGLIPYSPIAVKIHDDLFPLYDSIKVGYCILIDPPLNLENNHDSIRIQREYFLEEENWWDRAELIVWDQDKSDWEIYCSLNMGDDSIDKVYYSDMIDVVNQIYSEAENVVYYIDDSDWKANNNIYLNDKNKSWFIKGEVRVR